MGRALGSPKPTGSGRQKGTPNKRSDMSVKERLDSLGYDLVEKIIDDIALIADPAQRVKSHLQLLEYCDARRKSVEVIQEQSEPLKLTPDNIGELCRIARQASLAAV